MKDVGVMGSDGGKLRQVEQTTRQQTLLERFERVRGLTLWLCEPLEIEDFVVQSMPDVSPTKWHLAHTTWFFETFLLAKSPEHTAHDPRYEVLFNSYYNSVGEQFPRAKRGLVTRPTVREVFAYRSAVDEQMSALLGGPTLDAHTLDVVELGLHHEQQHQELLVTDIKHVLSQTPLYPVYRDALHDRLAQPARASSHAFSHFDGGTYQVGHDTARGFCFDNELPRHETFLHPFALGNRLVTVGEYMAFIEDGGYARHDLWLSQGWSMLHEQGWRAPLYWNTQSLADGEPRAFTLAGERALHPDEPVTHVSMFEADAYARWAGGRLPREHELEVAATRAPEHAVTRGNFVQDRWLHPVPAEEDSAGLTQLFGDGWEWTRSSYDAYPGYAPAAGALGEYNGKFMCNQYVLRGGSCATSRDHIRATYRNFFPSDARWQFTAIRVAKDLV